jgi:hypothetical protein
MTKRRTAILQSVALFAAFGASAESVDLENENLLVTAPPGYKVGFSDKKPNMVMTEFVPAKEAAENFRCGRNPTLRTLARRAKLRPRASPKPR